MKNAKKLLSVVLIAVFLAGCAQMERGTANVKTTAKMPKNMPVGPNTSNASTVSLMKNITVTKVFFFYSSKCPVCRNVLPYMELLRKTDEGSGKVKFYFCNVYNSSSCSNESLRVAKHIGLKYVPTVVIAHGMWIQEFQGVDVVKTALFLHMFGLPIPKAKLNNTTYSTQLCINCHLKQGKMPEKFNCTYCCHLSHLNQTAVNSSV